MSEEQFNKIFSKKLRFFLSASGMTQKELAARLKVSVTSVGNWVSGIKSPRMDKIDKMCEIFGCKRSDLMEEKPEHNYYIDKEARELAQFLFDNPEYRALFKASRNVRKEDLELVKGLIDRFSTRD